MCTVPKLIQFFFCCCMIQRRSWDQMMSPTLTHFRSLIWRITLQKRIQFDHRWMWRFLLKIWFTIRNLKMVNYNYISDYNLIWKYEKNTVFCQIKYTMCALMFTQLRTLMLYVFSFTFSVVGEEWQFQNRKIGVRDFEIKRRSPVRENDNHATEFNDRFFEKFHWER